MPESMIPLEDMREDLLEAMELSDRIKSTFAKVLTYTRHQLSDGSSPDMVALSGEAEEGEYLDWLSLHYLGGSDTVVRGSIDVWFNTVCSATMKQPFTGSEGRFFQATYLAAWQNLASQWPETHVELHLKQVLVDLKQYLTLEDQPERYPIGALMFCLGAEIGAAALRFLQEKKATPYSTDPYRKATAPVMALARLYTSLGQACGVPVYPPAPPKEGGGSGWSRPTTTESTP